MSMRNAITSATVVGIGLLSQARFCAAKPAYLSLLTAPDGQPAILAHMDIAINPKGTTAQQVLAASARDRNKTAHPEWIAAKACQMLWEGRGNDARRFFGDTKAATALWMVYFGSAQYYKVCTTRLAYMGIPWEIKAGPLVDIGWLVAPRPDQWTTGINAQMKTLTPWWGIGTTLPLILRRNGGIFKIQGGSIFIPGHNIFDGIALGLSFGRARPLSGRPPSLRHYIMVPFHATGEGDRLARKGESVDFQVFFRLRPVPKDLLSEVRAFQRAVRHSDRPKVRIDGTPRGKAYAKADPFGPKTTVFLEHGHEIKPLWFIAGRGVDYALFSGKHRGEAQLWIMKLRRTSGGFRSYGFAPGINRNICTDGLFGTESSVTQIDRFLAKKRVEKKMDRKR